jgi:hypothetical protein
VIHASLSDRARTVSLGSTFVLTLADMRPLACPATSGPVSRGTVIDRERASDRARCEHTAKSRWDTELVALRLHLGASGVGSEALQGRGERGLVDGAHMIDDVSTHTG